MELLQLEGENIVFFSFFHLFLIFYKILTNLQLSKKNLRTLVFDVEEIEEILIDGVRRKLIYKIYYKSNLSAFS